MNPESIEYQNLISRIFALPPFQQTTAHLIAAQHLSHSTQKKPPLFRSGFCFFR
jgi:hypothetical protein